MKHETSIFLYWIFSVYCALESLVRAILKWRILSNSKFLNRSVFILEWIWFFVFHSTYTCISKKTFIFINDKHGLTKYTRVFGSCVHVTDRLPVQVLGTCNRLYGCSLPSHTVTLGIGVDHRSPCTLN